jgi:hypothetical protein
VGLGVGATFWRLRDLLVLWKSHIPNVNVSLQKYDEVRVVNLPPQFDQNSLHGKISLPLNETRQFGGINL